MVDTNYNNQSFFVNQIYFCGGSQDPYKDLERALKAEIDPEMWQKMKGTVSFPFPKPETGKIAVKAINKHGDEAIKVFDIL